MKQTFFIIILMVLIVPSVSYAVPISDPSNPHNMSNLEDKSGPQAADNASGGTDQICVFCHTPHSSAPQSPLWNRPDPTGPAGGFELYGQNLVINTNPTESGYGEGTYPNGASRLCLSCHDGATSVGVLLGNQTIIMEGGLTTLAEINLATSHPISFTYDNAVLALLLVDYQLPTTGVDTPLDASGQMQCTTCHDPHEDTQAVTSLPFWRNDTSQVDSYYLDVCNNCHTGAAALPSPPILDLP